MKENSAFYFTCTDGHQMPVYRWLPAGPCKMVMLVAHGMAEHGGRYARFAKVLNKSGIAVYANDHRGHGIAVANKKQLGVPGNDWVNKQIEDLYGLMLQLKKEQDGLPVFLFGHSMGSFMAQRFAQIHGKDIDALILSGSNGHRDPLLPFGIGLSKLMMNLHGLAFKSGLIHHLTFSAFNQAFRPNRTSFDWLSRDPEEVDAYVNDPLCGFRSSVQLMYFLFVALRITFSQQAIELVPKQLPVYLFSGDKDPVSMQGKGVLALIRHWQAAGISAIETKLYKNGRHEMLNEINRDEVTVDLIVWIEKQLSKHLLITQTPAH